MQTHAPRWLHRTMLPNRTHAGRIWRCLRGHSPKRSRPGRHSPPITLNPISAPSGAREATLPNTLSSAHTAHVRYSRTTKGASRATAPANVLRLGASEADVGTRTRDPLLTMEVLYQLSYVGATPNPSVIAVQSIA